MIAHPRKNSSITFGNDNCIIKLFPCQIWHIDSWSGDEKYVFLSNRNVSIKLKVEDFENGFRKEHRHEAD